MSERTMGVGIKGTSFNRHGMTVPRKTVFSNGKDLPNGPVSLAIGPKTQSTMRQPPDRHI